MKTGGYLGIDIETDVLARIVSSRLGSSYRLVPLSVKCTYPVFRGETDDAPPVFVKVGPKEEWQRMSAVLAKLKGTGLAARMMTDECVDYRGFAVSMMTWLGGRTVFPEDMTDRQIDSFIAGNIKLSEALQGVTDYERVDAGPHAPERLYAELSDYAKRHPWSSRAFANLLSVPVERRTFANRKRVVIHGDFHAKNFGFQGDALSAVFDFGQVCDGLPCSDLVNALVERFSCLNMDEQTRRRLKERAQVILARVPWARDDMEAAVNMLRLRFAARRVEKHPNAFWAAFDIERRDRRIREILSCMEGRR